MNATLTLPGIAHARGSSIPTPRPLRWRESAEQQADPLHRQTATGLLLESDLIAITEKTRRLDGAMKTLERIDTGIADSRVKHSAYRTFSVTGLWSQAVSFFRRGFGVLMPEPGVRRQILESEISQRVGELRGVVEKVIVPSLAEVRTTYRERTFTKGRDIPPALMLISVPVEKVGKAVSFDVLRTAISRKSEASSHIQEGVQSEDARCIMTRGSGETKETLECAYHRPGKIVVYINGERQGTMWNDDALKLVSAFADNKPINLKRKRFTEYAVQ
jgi:hypothetical protein